MKKLTLEDLRELESRVKAASCRCEDAARVVITVYTGDCGLAAGARDVTAAFMQEMRDGGMSDITLLQADCPGLCAWEPLIRVECRGMEPVLYGGMDSGKVGRVLSEHVRDGRIISEWRVRRDNV